MTEFRVSTPLPSIPDDLTIPQFIFDFAQPLRPHRPQSVPWLIDDTTGSTTGSDELLHRTRALANALSSRWQIGDGDVVCIFSPNHVDYPSAIWAVHKLGGIITPANPGYTVDELVHQLLTSKATMIIAHPQFLTTALDAAQEVGIAQERIVLFNTPAKSTSLYASLNDLISFGLNGPDTAEKKLQPGEAKSKPAFLSFSSGTSGKAKAVLISHYNVISNIIQMAAHLKVNDPTCKNKRMDVGDIVTGVLPFFHIYGLVVNMHFVLFCGMSIVVTSRFKFAEFLKNITRYRITHLFVVPPQVVLLCKHPAVKSRALRHIKFCMSGAAPLSAELTQQLIKLLPSCTIGQGYGLTETCASVCFISPTRKVGTFGSAGELIPGIVARVVKSDGSLGGPGEEGELVVAGPSMALGYVNNPEATRETFADGWVRTGDSVYINGKNEVFIVDRLKEILKVRGFQVSPSELEGHLLDHKYVADACVVSLLDDYSGEIPLAYVVLNESLREQIGTSSRDLQRIKDTLLKHVSDNKAQYKWLSGGLEIVDSLPKNPSGKLLRRVLRDQARSRRRELAKL